MNNYKKYLVLLIFFQFCAAAMQQVQIQTKSESGKTVKLDIGSLQGVKSGDFADLTLKSGTLDVPRYSLVGPGRVLKVFQNFSYWYFPQGESSDLKIGKTYHLLLRRKTLEGRSDVKIDYRVSAYQNDNVKKMREKGERANFPKDLIQEDNTFESEVYKDELISDADYRKVKNVRMNKKSGALIMDEDFMEVQFLRADTNVINRKKIVKEYKDNLAKAQHKQQIKKINKLKYGYDELYYEVNNSNDPSKMRMSSQNYVSQKREEDKQLSRIPRETLDMIEKHGKGWSSDMDDTELKNYLLKTGVAREQARQKSVLTLQSGNEFTLYLGSNLTANYNTIDDSHQFNGFTMAVGYDLHLVRVTDQLHSWSFDVKFERGSLSIGQETVNSRITYGAFSGHLNYYFKNYPHSRNKFAWYIGAGLKRGNGDGTNANLNSDYKYEVSSVPSTQLGVKYRMAAGRDYEFSSRFGFGFNARLMYENLSVKTINEVQDDFQPNQTVSNMRLDIGLSIYF
jgi:hypothetical protein